MNDSGFTYEGLLGVSDKIDSVEYRKRFKGIAKNSDGIPLHLEDEAERRGRILADAYEQFYDSRKQALRDAGIQFSQLIRGDDGGPALVNLAACLSIPAFMQAVEQGDGPLFAVMVLHWMRASKDKEWVFSHLCEAVHAYSASSHLREQLARISHRDLREGR